MTCARRLSLQAPVLALLLAALNLLPAEPAWAQGSSPVWTSTLTAAEIVVFGVTERGCALYGNSAAELCSVALSNPTLTLNGATYNVAVASFGVNVDAIWLYLNADLREGSVQPAANNVLYTGKAGGTTNTLIVTYSDGAESIYTSSSAAENNGSIFYCSGSCQARIPAANEQVTLAFYLEPPAPPP